MRNYIKQLQFMKSLYHILFFIIIINITKSQYFSKNLQTIPIVFNSDNNFFVKTLVSITSVLENSGDNTSYNIYILVPKNFKKSFIAIFKKLEIKYFKCSINIINMNNILSKFKGTNGRPNTAYYRLFISSLLPKIYNKVIYLDSDTLTLGDLKSLYSIDMKKNYIAGFLDRFSWGLDYLKLKTDAFINSGVLLLNLYLLRKDDIVNKFLDFMYKNNDFLRNHDQTVLNYVCFGKIGILSPKFGTWNMYKIEDIKKYNKLLKKKYDLRQFILEAQNPVIVHFTGDYPKPWEDCENCDQTPFYKMWWDTTKKIDDFKKIKKYLTK